MPRRNAWENGRKLKEAGRAIKANLTLSEGERKESLPGSALDPEQSKGSSKERLARLWGVLEPKSPTKGAPSLPGKSLS